jgi:hypothetical protein
LEENREPRMRNAQRAEEMLRTNIRRKKMGTW